MLRGLVVALAVLAGAKLWAQDHLFREGAEDALLRAYRERAVAACQSQTLPLTADAPLWTRPDTVDLVIGRSSADVHIWQVHSALWPARYRHPHIVLTVAARGSSPVCEYDVIEGRAYLTQM